MSFLHKNQIYLKKINLLFAGDNEKAFGIEEDAKYYKQGVHYMAEKENVRCFVSSTYNKAHETDSIFSKTPKNVQYLVLFGCGLGDAIRYALDSRNFPELISLTVVEPSPAWFSILMNEVDMESAWGETNVKMTILVGHFPKVAGRSLADQIIVLKGNFSLTAHLSAHTIFAEYYSKMLNIMSEELRNMAVLLSTNRNLIHRKTYNEFFNLSLPSYIFRDIIDIFKGKTIIIVSAGPSLSKNIHLLESAKKKAVIVAVGSAAKILDNRGITPHFRMAIDPQPDLHIFSKLKEEHEPVPLIYSNAFCSEILASYRGTRIQACSTSDILTMFLYNKKYEHVQDIFVAGVSVANFAAEIFCASDIKKMIFVGQDMCMYEQRLYADGESEPFLAYKGIEDKNMLNLKDIYENDVVAPRNYYMIKEYLEKTIMRYADKIEFINSTEGGLGIKGAANTPLKEVLNAMEEDDIIPIIDKCFKEVNLFDFRDDLCELKKQLDDIERLNDENLNDLQKIKYIFLEDENFVHRDVYIEAFKSAKKNENDMKEIEFQKEILQPLLEIFLQIDCMTWVKGIDSADEKIKFRSILEIQLRTAWATKTVSAMYKRAFKEIFSENINTTPFFSNC